jgi:hypothetical protein
VLNITLSILDIIAKTDASVIRIVLIPALERALEVTWPWKDGALAHTTTSNCFSFEASYRYY